MTETPPLARVQDPGPALQKRADQMVPIGWCNVCIGVAKDALAHGREPGRIRAAVSQVPKIQMMEIPGAPGAMPAVVTVGVCWDCQEMKTVSSLMQGQAGQVPAG